MEFVLVLLFLQVLELLQKMPISYPQYVYTRTGWNEQWQIAYSNSVLQEDLDVIIIPFSHADAGMQ